MSTNAAMTQSIEEANRMLMDDIASNEDQYLSFFMAGDEYGIDILHVMEIRGWEKPTQIPQAPSYVNGVINLRGTIVPIIDLRSRFGLNEIEYSPTTVVIFLQGKVGNKNRIMGIVVDAVSEVYYFDNNMIKNAPEIVSCDDESIISGIATLKEKMIIILNMETLFSFEDDIVIPKNITESLQQSN